MIKAIANKLIHQKGAGRNVDERTAYGEACGITGIFLNLCLFAFKIVTGTLAGSVAVVADAWNNLSDALSSLVTLLGFGLASRKPDKEHPFGHGRYEYLAGMLVALAILMVGLELAKSSIEKLRSPSPVTFSWITAASLAVSIAVKWLMRAYNRKYGEKYDSEILLAVSSDARNDILSTSVVLASLFAEHLFSVQIDAWAGLFVSAFILWSGWKTLQDAVDPLLGMPPSEKFVQEIEDTVLAHKQVLGVHDLVVHDYGPGRRMISLHAEVPAGSNLLEIHDVIDNIEWELGSKYHCDAVIHMDPIVTDDPVTNRLRERTEKLVRSIDPSYSMHDFRTVQGKTHTNLIFDVVIPFNSRFSDEQAKEEIRRRIAGWEGNYRAVIHVDKDRTL